VFFDTWVQVGRVIAMGTGGYVALLVIVRLSGKRTLAKLNAFDLVVTVALGSTLATILLSSEVSLAEGLGALAVLVAAQFVVAWSSARVGFVRRAVKAEPSLLALHGRLLEDRMRANRVTPGEVRQAVRATGSGGLEHVAAVVLETDGSMSVIRADSLGTASALADVADADGRRGLG
jgi:uncharacterized membrane protein YcaP (DUF421 family)